MFEKKIEEIRNKPEHIRLRYAWGAVFFFMFFISILWIFSMKENLANIGGASEKLIDFSGNLKNDSDSLPSLKDVLEKNRTQIKEDIENSSRPAIPNNQN